eukprot:scaffold31631_cov60-Phaeocystis_antarctica.AAC.5
MRRLRAGELLLLTLPLHLLDVVRLPQPLLDALVELLLFALLERRQPLRSLLGELAQPGLPRCILPLRPPCAVPSAARASQPLLLCAVPCAHGAPRAAAPRSRPAAALLGAEPRLRVAHDPPRPSSCQPPLSPGSDVARLGPPPCCRAATSGRRARQPSEPTCTSLYLPPRG